VPTLSSDVVVLVVSRMVSVSICLPNTAMKNWYVDI
jgi:hypothetical protein